MTSGHGHMALALVSKVREAESGVARWRRDPGPRLPRLAGLGDAAPIRMAAFDYNVPPGIFAGCPTSAASSTSATAPTISLQRPDSAEGRAGDAAEDPGIIGCMTEYVLLYLLSHRRLQATYRRYQAERRWQEDYPALPERRADRGPRPRLDRPAVRRGASSTSATRSTVGPAARTACRGSTAITGAISSPPCLAPCDYVVCILPETKRRATSSMPGRWRS